MAGIPDLRVPAESWIDPVKELRDAAELAVRAEHLDLPALIRAVYALRPAGHGADVELRCDQVLALPSRHAHDLDGWLDAPTRSGPFLDLGCGAGGLLVAATDRARSAIGVDVSLVWLVVARKWILAHGGHPVLAAACGEYLPLEDGAVTGVVSLDVIEHVGDVRRVLQEIDRVTRPEGRLALATPNRLSLTAEPHVGVWGVGWLPVALQARYVGWRSGKPYAFTRLYSVPGMMALVRERTRFAAHVEVPRVPADEIARFSPTKAALARLYNACIDSAVLRMMLTLVCPFFRVIGERR